MRKFLGSVGVSAGSGALRVLTEPQAGVGSLYSLINGAKVLYIHAKAVVADAGRSGQQMFVGSENFSAASLKYNRELGIRTTNGTLISSVSAVLAADYAGGTPYGKS